MIPYGQQFIDQDDIDAVVRVLKGTHLTQGQSIPDFEQAICKSTGAEYCVAVANGTAALHIAVAALNLPPGSEGITSPITFVATSNSMLYSGIKPIFADIDPLSYCLAPEEVEKQITPQTKLIMPVHFAGQTCDMKAINKIAKQHDCYLIEDAAHAVGSNYADGSKVGSCRYSDMTIFSFHPVKTITTGEGGAVTTNNKALYEKLCALRSHGIISDPAKMTQCPRPAFHEMHSLGFNYRMTDIQAALGLSQLQKLERFKAARRRIVELYNNELAGIDGLILPFERNNLDSCFHLYVVKIDFSRLGKDRGKVMEELRTKGILTQVHYTPVHTQPYYQNKFGYKWGDYPQAEAYYEQCLSIPLYPAMTDGDIQTVIKAIKDIVKI